MTNPIDISARIKLEYELLKTNNTFKRHESQEESKTLFYRWRLGAMTAPEVAEIIGIKKEALYNLQKRLNRDIDVTQEDVASMADKSLLVLEHTETVKHVGEQIRKADSLPTKTESSNVPPDSKTDSDSDSSSRGDSLVAIYSNAQHIREVMVKIDALEADSVTEVALRMHRYVFLHEFDAYESTRKMLDPYLAYSHEKIQGMEDKHFWRMKAVFDLVDRKQKSVETKIQDMVTQYGTMLSAIAVESLDERDRKLEEMTELILDMVRQSEVSSGAKNGHPSTPFNGMTGSMMRRSVELLNRRDTRDAKVIDVEVSETEADEPTEDEN